MSNVNTLGNFTATVSINCTYAHVSSRCQMDVVVGLYIVILSSNADWPYSLKHVAAVKRNARNDIAVITESHLKSKHIDNVVVVSGSRYCDETENGVAVAESRCT